MLIIFVAHVTDNPCAGCIPEGFGWSDDTEMFVFCSGFAAAIAFGGSFATAGFGYGTVRIVHRVWQIYVAHIAMFVFIAAAMVAGTRLFGIDYLAALNLRWFFANAADRKSVV